MAVLTTPKPSARGSMSAAPGAVSGSRDWAAFLATVIGREEQGQTWTLSGSARDRREADAP